MSMATLRTSPDDVVDVTYDIADVNGDVANVLSAIEKKATSLRLFVSCDETSGGLRRLVQRLRFCRRRRTRRPREALA